MMGFVVEINRGCDERLIVPERGDVSNFCVTKVFSNPSLVDFIFRQALMDGRLLIGQTVITWHEDSSYRSSTNKLKYNIHCRIAPIANDAATIPHFQAVTSPNSKRIKYVAAAVVNAPSRVTSRAMRFAMLNPLLVGGMILTRHLKAGSVSGNF